MKWLTALMQVAERLPIERLFVKPPSNKKRLEELQGILGEARTKPVEAPTESPPEEIPEEYEDLKGYLEPRRQKVHLEPPLANGVSIEETVAYQNREIGKLLLRMERHCVQKFRIAGKACDCGVSKHLLDIESLCEETISMVSNPEIYYNIIELGKEIAPKAVPAIVGTGQYDAEYPNYSNTYRALRKELLGTLDPDSLSAKEIKQKQEIVEDEREKALLPTKNS